ncbi:MAG: hypothetical protein WCA34_06220, partial [Candidatus Acidiferrales bacterium]
MRDMNGFVGSTTAAAIANTRIPYRAPVTRAIIIMRCATAALRAALLRILGLAQQVLDAIAVLFRLV